MGPFSVFGSPCRTGRLVMGQTLRKTSRTVNSSSAKPAELRKKWPCSDLEHGQSDREEVCPKHDCTLN